MNKKIYEKIGETVYRKTLDSGLNVAVIPKEGFTKTYALFATDFGSVDCQLHFTDGDVSVPDGIAHFLEHKMFEQPDGGNAFDLFSKYGAKANAFTSFDMTAYLFSATDHFEECLRHLLGYVSTPHFTAENVAKEQGIIGQEIKMYKDDPGWSVFFGMLRCLYREHPISIDIAGSVQSISEITHDTLNLCYDSCYHPSNMSLCVVGNVRPDDVFRIAEEIVPVRPPGAVSAVIFPEDCAVAYEYKEQKMSVANPLFTIGFKEKATDERLKADAAYSVILDIMFGRSSRLYNELYKEGLITSLSASYNNGKGYAFVEISGESKNPQEVYERVCGEIKRFRTQGICENDIDIAKKALYGKYLKGTNEPENVASGFVSFAFFGEDYFSYGDRLMEVAKADLQNILHTGLLGSAISIISPI